MSTELKTTKNTIVDTAYQEAVKKHGAEEIILFDLVTEGGEQLTDIVALKPSYTVACNYMTWVDKSMERANNALLNACLLTHKEEVRGDKEFSFGAAGEIAKEIKVATATRKKH